MTTLCTFPGRAGDLLWALPSVRCISEALGEPVGLQVAGEFEGLGPVISAQPYIRYVWSDSRWALTPPEEWLAPARTDTDTERVIHLGYRGWPQQTLPHETYERARIECAAFGLPLPPLDLDTPWLSVTPNGPADLAVGFTEQWFELKYGLLRLLTRSLPITLMWDCFPGGRWVDEGGFWPTTWSEAATRIASSRVFLGCCSAPHVLAVALGVPVVLMEPCEARHNPILYPVGTTGPQVTLVRGHDGLPTFDARAVRTAVQTALRGPPWLTRSARHTTRSVSRS